MTGGSVSQGTEFQEQKEDGCLPHRDGEWLGET